MRAGGFCIVVADLIGPRGEGRNPHDACGVTLGNTDRGRASEPGKVHPCPDIGATHAT